MSTYIIAESPCIGAEMSQYAPFHCVPTSDSPHSIASQWHIVAIQHESVTEWANIGAQLKEKRAAHREVVTLSLGRKPWAKDWRLPQGDIVAM